MSTGPSRCRQTRLDVDWAVQMSTGPSRCRQTRLDVDRTVQHHWVSRGIDGRAVPTTGEPCRGRQRCGEVGRGVRGSTGEIWRPLDGRGVPWMDVASPGWSWRPRDGRDVVGMVIRKWVWTTKIRHGDMAFS